MAATTNEELKTLLKEGKIQEFNGVRPAGKIYFSGIDLSGADLTEANLRRADLIEANLAGANLTKANLTGANLYRADLTGANLTGGNLTKANLRGVNLWSVCGLSKEQQQLIINNLKKSWLDESS